MHDRVAKQLIRSRDAVTRWREGQWPRPSDAPRGHAPGADPHRLLLLGAGPASGWGVGSHELALPGTLARVVSAWTARGCTVDLVTDTDMTAATASTSVRDRDLTRYDAIIVTLGVNDALMLTAPSAWRQALADLLQVLVGGTFVDTEILVVGIQPIRSIPTFDTLLHGPAARRALLLNEASASLCAETDRATFVALPAPVSVDPESDRHRTPAQYQFWAKCLALPVVALLARQPGTAAGHHDESGAPSVWRESVRQRAVDQLDRTGAVADHQLQRIVTVARRAFDVETAIITVVDQDRQWNLAQAGRPANEVARVDSFCNLAIRGRDVMVVRDARADDRFRQNSLVTGEQQLRFYAGFPLETPSGERLGALCVIDSSPRGVADDVDVTLLRELGHLVQHELERHMPPADARPPVE